MKWTWGSVAGDLGDAGGHMDPHGKQLAPKMLILILFRTEAASYGTEE